MVRRWGSRFLGHVQSTEGSKTHSIHHGLVPFSASALVPTKATVRLLRGSVEQLIDCNSGSERLDEEYRLDMVLKDIAEKGVHVRTSARILHSINIV